MNKLRFISLLLFSALSLSSPGCVPANECSIDSKTLADGPTVPEGFGVNIHFVDALPGELPLLQQGGFRWVRMDLKWDATETEKGRYDFSAYDRLLTSLEPLGIRALFILDYGNPLYYNGAPRNEASRQAFARWAVAAAKHFGGRGLLWELYNEPNHSLFWPPKPDVQEYIALARTVGRAFRESVPNEKLIGPATSEIDFDFVESCLKAGLLEYWYAVSIHPYRRTDPETVASDYCRLRELIKTYDRSGRAVPIISSEWGYSAGWPNLDENRQAELLARAWLTNLANGIALSIWYDWRDDGADATEPEHHFGTVRNAFHEGRQPVFDPKPSYFAAKTLSTFFSGFRFEQRLDAASAENYVLLFRKGSELRYAAWTTGSTAKITIPISAGHYRVIGHTGEDRGALNATRQGLILNLTKAPVYFR